MEITMLTRTTLMMLQEAYKAGMACTQEQKRDNTPEALAEISSHVILQKFMWLEDHHTTTIG